jgi:hypothetical protein
LIFKRTLSESFVKKLPNFFKDLLRYPIRIQIIEFNSSIRFINKSIYAALSFSGNMKKFTFVSATRRGLIVSTVSDLRYLEIDLHTDSAK